jgi:F0F1-type ATP synthase assembly protein I
VLTGPPDSRNEFGSYLALAQVGLEMVVPIGVGMALDHYFHWTPWATTVGAVLGLAGGLTHLVLWVMRDGGAGPSQRRQDKP